MNLVFLNAIELCDRYIWMDIIVLEEVFYHNM
jgi:hypothetical protein